MELQRYHVVSDKLYKGKQREPYMSHLSFELTTALKKDFNFAYSETEENALGPIADLHLLKTSLAIRQKSQETSFWDVIHSLVLSAWVSLVDPRLFGNDY